MAAWPLSDQETGLLALHLDHPGVRAPAAAYALTRRDPYPGGQNLSSGPIDEPRRKNAMRFLKWVPGDAHHRCLRRSRCITWTARQYNRKRMIAIESFGVMAFSSMNDPNTQ